MRGRAVAVGLAALAGALVLVGAQGPVRALAVAGLALIAPGLAWAGHLPGPTTAERAALVVGLSLAADLLVALVLLAAGGLTPAAMATALVAITLLGAALTPGADRAAAETNPAEAQP
jgi:hypothetical protein